MGFAVGRRKLKRLGGYVEELRAPSSEENMRGESLKGGKERSIRSVGIS